MSATGREAAASGYGLLVKENALPFVAKRADTGV